MNVAIERDLARDTYNVYVVSEAVFSTERTIMRYGPDGQHEWEVITEGESVAPSIVIPNDVFARLFDAMSEYIRDYGKPDFLIIEAWHQEQQRVNKFIDRLLEADR